MFNPMRSTLQSRRDIKKYDGEFIKYFDLGKHLPLNHYQVGKTKPEHPMRVNVKCDCGDIVTIQEGTHTVDSNGIVMPSLGHACGYHEWVRLEGWSG